MKRSSFGGLGKSVETDCCDCLCLRYGLRIVISEGVKPVPPCGPNVPVDCCGKRWVSGTDARYKCNAASVTLYFSCLAGLRQDNHEQPQTLWPNVFQIVACEQPYIIIRPESCKGNTWMGRTRSDHQNEGDSANGDREAGHYYWLRQSGKLRRSSPDRRGGDSQRSCQCGYARRKRVLANSKSRRTATSLLANELNGDHSVRTTARESRFSRRFRGGPVITSGR